MLLETTFDCISQVNDADIDAIGRIDHVLLRGCFQHSKEWDRQERQSAIKGKKSASGKKTSYIDDNSVSSIYSTVFACTAFLDQPLGNGTAIASKNAGTRA